MSFDDDFDVDGFFAELENFRFRDLIDWEGIKYHPDTNVSEKVMYSMENKIRELLSQGFHSISIRRGSKGCTPTLSYRSPGSRSIWQEIADKSELGMSAESIRENVILGTKMAAKMRFAQ